MIKKILTAGAVGLILFSLNLSGSAVEFTADGNTLFLVHFNKGLDADFAKGKKKHVKGSAELTRNNGGKYREGLVCRQGVLAPSGRATKKVKEEVPFRPLAFPTDGNIDLKKGTLEFWFQMGSGQDTNISYYSLVDIPSKSTYLPEIKGSKGLVLIVTGSQEIKQSLYYFLPDQTLIHVSIKWLPGEWHHVAVIWDEKEAIFFLDGEKRGTLPMTSGGLFGGEAANLTGEFYIGGVPMGLDHYCPEGVIDEFRISNTKRYVDNFTP